MAGTEFVPDGPRITTWSQDLLDGLARERRLKGPRSARRYTNMASPPNHAIPDREADSGAEPDRVTQADRLAGKAQDLLRRVNDSLKKQRQAGADIDKLQSRQGAADGQPTEHLGAEAERAGVALAESSRIMASSRRDLEDLVPEVNRLRWDIEELRGDILLSSPEARGGTSGGWFDRIDRLFPLERGDESLGTNSRALLDLYLIELHRLGSSLNAGRRADETRRRRGPRADDSRNRKIVEVVERILLGVNANSFRSPIPSQLKTICTDLDEEEVRFMATINKSMIQGATPSNSPWQDALKAGDSRKIIDQIRWAFRWVAQNPE